MLMSVEQGAFRALWRVWCCSLLPVGLLLRGVSMLRSCGDPSPPDVPPLYSFVPQSRIQSAFAALSSAARLNFQMVHLAHNYTELETGASEPGAPARTHQTIVHLSC
jgi:hypothetical protein